MCFFEPTKSKYLYLTVSNMFHANSSKVEQAAKSWIEFNFESPFNFVFIPFMSFAWLETFLVMLTQHWGEKSSRMNWLEMKISLTYKKVKEPSCTVMLKPFYPANYLSKLVIPILNRSLKSWNLNRAKMKRSKFPLHASHYHFNIPLLLLSSLFWVLKEWTKDA